MSKYYKAEDITELISACEWRMTLAKERHGEGFVDYSKQVLDVDELTKRLSDLPTIEVSEEQSSKLKVCDYYYKGYCSKYDDGCFHQCVQKQVSEEDELKFYYVDSIDAYWIGQRLDNCYYAEWIDGLGFVWSKSRYLPWGEHVIAPDTLWKEHTYPSEPREIPFTEWIVGFMKKHTSEDAISREWLIKQWDKMSVRGRTEFDQEIMVAPSVIPQQKEGEWIPCSERLPKDSGHYICSFVQPRRIDKIHIGLAYWNSGRWVVGYNASEITAWMPLPEPWKGADDE